MNYTTIEHIREIINDGAIYWTLRDRNNSAILAEQTAAISAGDSYDKLTRNIKEMRGDFIKLSLSQRNPAEKNAGGNVKNYGPYNIEIQNAGNVAAAISGPPIFNQVGPTWLEHISLMRENERLTWQAKDLERQINEAQNGKIEKIAGYFAPLLDRIIPGQQIAQTPPQVSAAPLTFTVPDETTYKNLYEVSQRPYFNEVLNRLNAGGEFLWNQVLENLNITNDANI